MVENVGSDLAETEKPELAEHEESAKRRQIMEGAREVFLAQGFDAASMGRSHARLRSRKGRFTFTSTYSRPLLMGSAGRRRKPCFPSIQLITTSKLCSPGLAAALSNSCAAQEPFRCCAQSSPSRIVCQRSAGSSTKRVLRRGYEALSLSRESGRWRYLAIEDCEVAAAQFLDSCVATILKPLLFNASEAPRDERIDHVVGIAVCTFLAAYRPVA